MILYENGFEDTPENSLTFGNEAALQREIEKSKSLKIERLHLRDKIEKLKKDNKRLLKWNQNLKAKLKALESTELNTAIDLSKIEKKSNNPQTYWTQLTRISMVLIFLFIASYFVFFKP